MADEITFGSLSAENVKLESKSDPKSDPKPSPAKEQAPKTPEPEAVAPEEETSMSEDSAIAREDRVRAAAAAAREANDAKISEQLNAARENARDEYDNSDRGAVAHSNAEAERLMRLPTPETLEATGSVVGDPTRGPAS